MLTQGEFTRRLEVLAADHRQETCIVLTVQARGGIGLFQTSRRLLPLRTNYRSRGFTLLTQPRMQCTCMPPVRLGFLPGRRISSCKQLSAYTVYGMDTG